MDQVQLAPLKYGSNVYVKTTTMAECTGVYKGLMETEQTIRLADVKYSNAASSVYIKPRNYKSLVLPLHNIAHIEGIENETSDKSLVAFSAQQQQRSETFPSNSFAAENIQYQGNMATTGAQMQEFCQQLFSNCNFTQLLQSKKMCETKLYIRLPSYLANIFRQPKWCFEETQPPDATVTPATAIDLDNESERLAIVKPSSVEISKSFMQDSSATGELDQIGETQFLELCTEFGNLNLMASFYGKADRTMEAAEVDLSNFDEDNPFVQIRIGNLCLKASKEMENAINEEKTTTANEADTNCLDEI